VVVAFAAAAVVLLALLLDLLSPRLREWRQRPGRSRSVGKPEAVVQDPGRERRAEHKARALLRSCVNEEEWAMYRDLGFIRVWGSGAGRMHTRRSVPECAYLLYPHLPIVAYTPKTGRLVGEYCVTFEDQTRPYGSSRLPDADDVLAKWMALRGDEDEVISMANMHLPGRQVAIDQVQRDLRRLAQWESSNLRDQDRLGRDGQTGRHTAAAS
jgi:hypothetical protein